MCRFDHPTFLTFPTSATRLGTREALGDKGVPNLPNLPNLFSHVGACAHVRVCRRMHRPVRTHARARLTLFTLGRLGRLGRARRHKAFKVPNLCPTSARLGT